jgi:helix-turn-helix protein
MLHRFKPSNAADGTAARRGSGAPPTRSHFGSLSAAREHQRDWTRAHSTAGRPNTPHEKLPEGPPLARASARRMVPMAMPMVTQTTGDEDMLGTKAAAAVFGIGASTIRQLCLHGKLPHQFNGRREYVISARALREYLTENPPISRSKTPTVEEVAGVCRSELVLLDRHGDATADTLAEAAEIHPGNARKHLRLAESYELVTPAGKVPAGDFGERRATLWKITPRGKTVVRSLTSTSGGVKKK